MSLGMAIDLTRELHKMVFPKEKRPRKFRYSESRSRERSKFLDDYAEDIKYMTLAMLKKKAFSFDLQDVLQEVRKRALTSRSWYSKKWYSEEGKCGSKATTFLYVVIRNVIQSMIKKEPKEIPFSQLNNTRQVLQDGDYREFEVTLDESVMDEEDRGYDYIDRVIDIQEELKDNKPLLSYIFYGYLMGYKNRDIARELLVTDAFIGLEWNRFVQTFRRFRCNPLLFLQKKLSVLPA